MDQIQAMRVFVRVVEAGNFTRAADSLDLPKGTVTKQIQALEARVRVKLLNRTTRRVTVTPDGAAYYERAARLLNDFDDLEASMVNTQTAPSGRLRLDVGSSMARLIIIPALTEFCERYPDIQIDLGVGDRLVDLISDNVDCVIRGGRAQRPVPGGAPHRLDELGHRGLARLPGTPWRAPASVRTGYEAPDRRLLLGPYAAHVPAGIPAGR